MRSNVADCTTSPHFGVLVVWARRPVAKLEPARSRFFLVHRCASRQKTTQNNQRKLLATRVSFFLRIASGVWESLLSFRTKPQILVVSPIRTASACGHSNLFCRPVGAEISSSSWVRRGFLPAFQPGNLSRFFTRGERWAYSQHHLNARMPRTIPAPRSSQRPPSPARMRTCVVGHETGSPQPGRLSVTPTTPR